MTFKYFSTKTFPEIGPVAYRQWKADSHCKFIHGYALTFHFEFGSNELDVRNWCVDFGGLKELKDLLEEWFDHTLLVAVDDPHRDELLRLGELKLAQITEVERTGCEGIADFLYRFINDGWLKSQYGDRVWCTRVEVRETSKNMAGVQGTPETWEKHWSAEQET